MFFRFYEELAIDSKRIQREIDAYTAAIAIFDRRLAEVEPRTQLLLDIESTMQSLLRRDNLITYTPSVTVANLETLLKQARDFFSRYVNRAGIAPTAPPQMIANVEDPTISIISDKFNTAMGTLDFGGILDYD